MARGTVEVKKVETVFEELDRMHQAIRQRAYDLSRNGGTLLGGALGDWLTADQELVSKPPIELRQKDSRFEVLVALPGIEARDQGRGFARRSSRRYGSCFRVRSGQLLPNDKFPRERRPGKC